MDGETLFHTRRDEVDERQHAENSDEHDEVDNGRVTGEGSGDNVAIQCQNEKRP